MTRTFSPFERLTSRSLAAGISALMLIGCGHIETYHSLFRAPLPPTKDVQIFLEEAPPKTFSEVGLVQVVGHGNKADRTNVIEAVRQEAQRMGCDAVVKTRFNEGGTMSHAIGVCVVWVELTQHSIARLDRRACPSLRVLRSFRSASRRSLTCSVRRSRPSDARRVTSRSR
jgi:hypothetical protein